VVRPECSQAFQVAYGPDGDWVRLFRRDPQYIRTDFLADCDDPARFVTIDFWTSREACLAFRERSHSEFEALDEKFGEFTVQELHLGDFELLDKPVSTR
jgi:hypothetical protein